MQKDFIKDRTIVALPARRWSCTIEVALMNIELGWEQQQRDLRSYAVIEWMSDLDAAERMRDSHGLTQEQHSDLVEALRKRNREVWGPFSADSLAVNA